MRWLGRLPKDGKGFGGVGLRGGGGLTVGVDDAQVVHLSSLLHESEGNVDRLTEQLKVMAMTGCLPRFLQFWGGAEPCPSCWAYSCSRTSFGRLRDRRSGRP